MLPARNCEMDTNFCRQYQATGIFIDNDSASSNWKHLGVKAFGAPWTDRCSGGEKSCHSMGKRIFYGMIYARKHDEGFFVLFLSFIGGVHFIRFPVLRS